MSYVPLSVREGSRRKKLGWFVRGQRERAAVWLAPWLSSHLASVKLLTWEVADERDRAVAALRTLRDLRSSHDGHLLVSNLQARGIIDRALKTWPLTRATGGPASQEDPGEEWGATGQPLGWEGGHAGTRQAQHREPPEGLRYSERKLYRESPDPRVRSVLERLARMRRAEKEKEEGSISVSSPGFSSGVTPERSPSND